MTVPTDDVTPSLSKLALRHPLVYTLEKNSNRNVKILTCIHRATNGPLTMGPEVLSTLPTLSRTLLNQLNHL